MARKIKEILTENPIDAESLSLFVSRGNELKALDKALRLFSVVILEGSVGVGKTSLGNFYRYSKDRGVLTPEVEISVNPEWTTKEFMFEVLNSLSLAIENGGLSRFKVLKFESAFESFAQKYKDLKDTGFGIQGAGFGFSQNQTSNNRAVITEISLAQDLRKMASMCNQISTQSNPVIVQLNNFDLANYDEKVILDFFGRNRNIFQIPNVAWIVSGSPGLTKLLETKMPKFGDLIARPIKISPLSKEDTVAALKLRLKQLNIKVENRVLENIYLYHSPRLREVLKILKPLIEDLKEVKQSKLYGYYDMFLPEAKELSDTDKQYLIYVINHPGIYHPDLTKEFEVDRSTVVKRVQKLINLGFISQREKQYYPKFMTIYLSWLRDMGEEK